VTTKIGERLALIRGDRSQASFAAEIGIHKNSLGNYERGNRTPDSTVLEKLMQAGYNANWVISGEGSMLLATGEDASLDNHIYAKSPEHAEAKADYIRERFFDDKEAAARSEQRLVSVGERLRGIRESLEEIESDIGYQPDEFWHQTLMTLMFAHNLDEAGAAILLDSLKKRLNT